MKILVTAFDPFGGESVNAAQEALARLPERVAGAEIVKLTVPTVFGACVEPVIRAVEAHAPDAVLCLGQAAGRRALTPERAALNVDDARIPDNAGDQPTDQPIVPGGPAAYFATLPVKAMVRAIRAAGLPADVSNSAGTFVCNHLMYGLLHYLAETRPGTPGGFLHVPAAAGQGDLFLLPPEDASRGVAAAITAIVDFLRGN